MAWDYLISFGLGATGALFIVWLRWIGSLPKFKSSIEILQIEDEYEEVRQNIAKRLKNGDVISEAEVKHSNDLRDDIWRQRSICFLWSALIYVALGGVTALLFVGLQAQDLTELTIIKMISAGALWSTFYSFIDVTNAEKFIIAKREEETRIQDEGLNRITSKCEEEIKRLYDELHDTANRYNELVDKYEELKQQKNVGV